MRRYASIALLAAFWLALLAGQTMAQESTGQLCLRAFEDRNGNAQEDPGEPRITRNLNATLYNERGVVIATQFMSDSPNAASGTLCFQQLQGGTYTIRVNAVNYVATTPQEFVAQVTDTGRPPIFVYGGQRVTSPAPAAEAADGGTFNLSATEQRTLLRRLLIAVVGAIIAVVVMAVFGIILYAAFFRRRTAPAGQQPPSRGDRAGYIPPADAPAGSGIEFPPVNPDEDTGRMRAVRTGDTDVPDSAPESIMTIDDDDFRFEPLDRIAEESAADDDFSFTDDDSTPPAANRDDDNDDTTTENDDDIDTRFRPPGS